MFAILRSQLRKMEDLLVKGTSEKVYAEENQKETTQAVSVGAKRFK